MNKWIYETEGNNTVRYVLGIVGKKPLICIGINPSTAEPDSLDRTINKVENIAFNNGYDSWMMFNIYPKRDTIFDNLHYMCNDNIHIKNIRIIKKYINEIENPTIWVAFGDHIYHRKYLIPCFYDICNAIKDKNITWVTTGLNKSGTPKHPLYQKNNSVLQVFNMEKFIKSLEAKMKSSQKAL
ncbi:MAG: DUF1643 domain-containing protein [Candidatus Gastranaerophilales bacterium]|jgi:hypothetical protein|nr:DUF1643 domain-containing protein [Candidatus Gastranaerophilales bacterium]